MARNEEKAASMLNRWKSLKSGEGKERKRRPKLSSDCDSLDDALFFKSELYRDLSQKIVQLQDGTLSDEQIRVLNDEANRLRRVHYHWERRIEELGGPTNWAAKKAEDELLSIDGTKYFGVSRRLPEVKEWLQKHPKVAEKFADKGTEGQAKKRKKRDEEPHKPRISDELYYGELEGEELEALERRAEEEAFEKAERKCYAEKEPMPEEGEDVPDMEEFSRYVVQREKEKLLADL